MLRRKFMDFSYSDPFIYTSHSQYTHKFTFVQITKP